MVTNSGSNTVTDIGTSWNLTLGTGGYPDPVAVTPIDQYAFVTNASPGTVTVIGDADTVGTIATSHDPGQAYQAADEMKIAGKWPRGLTPRAEHDGVRLHGGD